MSTTEKFIHNLILLTKVVSWAGIAALEVIAILAYVLNPYPMIAAMIVWLVLVVTSIITAAQIWAGA